MNLSRWRRVVPLLLLGLTVAVWLPVTGGVERAAGGGPWSAWIYNDATGALIRVFPDGVAPESYLFPLPAGVSSLPYSLAFSRTGDRFAACLTDDAGVTSVRVYDIYDALYRGAYVASGRVEGCWLERYAFSEDGSQVAFGLFNHYPFDADPRPGWELIVMDAQTGAVLHRLTADDPAVTALGIDVGGTIPAVVTFEMQTPATPGRIAFRPVQYGTEGMPEYHSLIWQLDDGSVRVEGLHGKGVLDLLLPTGEMLYLDEFDDLPKGVLEGPGFLYNVVLYANPSGDHYPVYHTGAVVLGSPAFIDDGRRFAVMTYAPPGPPDWFALDREGASMPLPVEGETYRVWGTPDGYVYLLGGGVEPAVPAVRYGRFMPDGSIETFEAWSGVLGEYWRLVWVSPLTGGEDLPPFAPLPMLGEPPTLPPTATAAPAFPTATTAPTGLTIGGYAAVNTTAGDMLRVRSGPGLEHGVLFLLPSRTIVIVREGPVSASGYTWWRVETLDGRTGWAVDGVPEGDGWLPTLIPSAG